MRNELILAAGLLALDIGFAEASTVTVNLYPNADGNSQVSLVAIACPTSIGNSVSVTLCNFGGGGGVGSNAAAGPTGAAVPADASYTAFSNAGGTLTGVAPSAGNYLPVEDYLLDALISGGALSVSAASLPLPTGAATSALQTTANTDLATINTTLGTPMQASGGTVGLSGTLPAYAATPTFNLGTLNGAATAAGVATVNTTLGTPMQNSGGTVGISGTLPSFTSQQTVTTTPKVGTLAVGSPALITTGGTAVSVTVANGCYVQNGYTATSQNIAAAESLFANPVTTAVNGSSSVGNSEIQPGSSFNCPPGTTTLSLNAATSAHRYNVVVW